MNKKQSAYPAKRPIAAVLLLMVFFFVTGTCFTAHADEPAKAVTSRHDLVFLPAWQLADMIRTGGVTSSEVVEAYLEQIEKHNKSLNAIVTLDAQGARKRAREADEALKRGEVWGPLHGVPVTIKDNYATAGMKTTSSLPDLAGYVPKYDATVVQKIKKAGAVILGKTNMPALGMDLQTRSPVFGVANNPWDLKRTTGGSSGGDAAAVAAGLTALGIGNDIGGSIRTPSHFCGIYGIKPTENLISGYGTSPGLPTGGVRSIRHMACSGPLARSIEDLKLALSVMAGPYQKVPDVPVIDLSSAKPRPLKDLHVTWTDDFGGVPVTAETKEALKAFADKLAAQGCNVEKLSGSIFEPHLQAVKDEWKDLYHVEESNLPNVDFKDAWTTYGRLMDLELGANQPSLFRLVNYLIGWRYRSGVPTISIVFPQTYAKYLQTLTRRDFFVSAMDDFMQGRYVLLCPVTSTPAFEHIEPSLYFGAYPIYNDPVLVDGRPVKYLVANTSYASIFNLTGSPVVVIPMGYTKSGLPIGVQIVGKRWRDMELLGIAGQLDQIAGQYRRPSGY
jgi:amidase